MAKLIKRRQGIDNMTRLQICQFVASQTTPPTTKLIRDWAEKTFGRTFPQSTISTLLRSNGLQIKQNGGRGRKCRKDALVARSNRQQDRQLISTRTGVLLCQLKLLADGRCRGRSSDHPEVEIMMLEETYLLLRRSYLLNREEEISVACLHDVSRDLFEKNRNAQLPKNISQFLNQIYDKYFLMNVIFQFLFNGLKYHDMFAKLQSVYPEICSTNNNNNYNNSVPNSNAPSPGALYSPAIPATPPREEDTSTPQFGSFSSLSYQISGPISPPTEHSPYADYEYSFHPAAQQAYTQKVPISFTEKWQPIHHNYYQKDSRQVSQIKLPYPAMGAPIPVVTSTFAPRGPLDVPPSTLQLIPAKHNMFMGYDFKKDTCAMANMEYIELLENVYTFTGHSAAQGYHHQQ